MFSSRWAARIAINLHRCLPTSSVAEVTPGEVDTDTRASSLSQEGLEPGSSAFTAAALTTTLLRF